MPKIRSQQIYDLYWQFTAERQRIFEKRLQGEAGPWTNDPILQTYKFCNVFRAADRVSQYLINEVAYAPEQHTPADRLFQILAFRMFSRPETWEGLKAELNEIPTIAHIKNGSLLRALERVKRKQQKLYTGAFILCAADAYGEKQKHKNHVALFEDMFIKNTLGERLLDARSLKEIFDLLQTFPLIGKFMAYQIAIDLNYSEHINFSENDFTCAGPGALRGINKVFSDLQGTTPEQIIQEMVQNQHREFDRLGLQFNGLFGRPLQAIDVQNLFCEVDKYCRQALPNLKSARTRIKSKFKEDQRKINYFFPPKWRIEVARQT